MNTDVKTAKSSWAWLEEKFGRRDLLLKAGWGFFYRVAHAARKAGSIEQAMRTARGFMEQATHAVAIRDGIAWPQAYRDVARYAVERTQ